MQRIILHIDFDSFYASVEQQDHPSLAHKPIGVTSTNGRTCIIAASREAKQLGIGSPSRTHDALKICPTMQFVAANFVRYWEVSQQFLEICKKFSPTIEIFSIDEVFIDVTYSSRLFGTTEQLIANLKKRLKDELGEHITASVGVAHNKLLAKLASGMKKPNGIMRISPSNVWQVYQAAKLTDICGIGRGFSKRLSAMGIKTPWQLHFVPLHSLTAEFGDVQGRFLYDVGQARDMRPVISYEYWEPIKSVGRQYCLPHNEYDERKILQTIYELCEEVTSKLRRLGKKAKTVGIYLGGSTRVHTRYTLGRHIDTGKELFDLLLSLTPKLPEYVRQISIWTGGLEDASHLSRSLFLSDQKQERLTATVDAINTKFGNHTIRNGFLLYADKLTTVPNGYRSSLPR